MDTFLQLLAMEGLLTIYMRKDEYAIPCVDTDSFMGFNDGDLKPL